MQIDKQCHLYMFVNTKSGGRWGVDYMQLPSKFNYQNKKFHKVTIRVIDLLHHLNKVEALQQIKELSTQQCNDIRIIICGGDGSVLWVVSEIVDYEININRVVFGIIPIGTGNDFSRTLGWGCQPVKIKNKDTTKLQQLICKWINSTINKFDIWDVGIEVNKEKGSIFQVRNKVQMKLNTNKLRKCFSNYVGIGLDAKVSYKAEKKRKKYKCCNMIMFGFIGFCNFFKKQRQLTEYIDEFSQSQEDNSIDLQNQINLQDSTVDPIQLLSPQQDKSFDKNKSSSNCSILLKQGYCGLVCMNTPSYMAGIRNVWDTNTIATSNQKKKFVKQKIDDGMIEFLGYKSELRLCLERIFRSGAKVAQGTGPFHIAIDDQVPNHLNYIQIDGEGFKIIGLKSIIIQKTNKIPNSQIRVMVNLSP